MHMLTKYYSDHMNFRSGGALGSYGCTGGTRRGGPIGPIFNRRSNIFVLDLLPKFHQNRMRIVRVIVLTNDDDDNDNDNDNDYDNDNDNDNDNHNDDDYIQTHNKVF